MTPKARAMIFKLGNFWVGIVYSNDSTQQGSYGAPLGFSISESHAGAVREIEKAMMSSQIREMMEMMRTVFGAAKTNADGQNFVMPASPYVQ